MKGGEKPNSIARLFREEWGKKGGVKGAEGKNSGGKEEINCTLPFVYHELKVRGLWTKKKLGMWWGNWNSEPSRAHDLARQEGGSSKTRRYMVNISCKGVTQGNRTSNRD